jgi:hypothetical protein
LFNDAWYVQIGKKQILLATGKANEEADYRKFYKVMAEEDPTRLLVLTADTQAATVCDLFLEWSAKHNEPETKGGQPMHWMVRLTKDWYCRFRRRPSGREVLTEAVERAMVEQAMETAMIDEIQQLNNAWVIGLIP